MKKCILLTAILLLLFGRVQAAKRYWVGNGSNINWNDTLNWSSTSGGTGGASVPGSNDTAYFNGSGTGQCKLNINISVKRIEIASGYTDTLKQNKHSITLGTGGYLQAGGKFYGDSTDITISGTYSVTAGTFRCTQSSMTCSSTFYIDATHATFSHNNGKVIFNATQTISGVNTITFYKLEFNASGSDKTFTVNNTASLLAVNDLVLSGSFGVTLNTGNIYARGDIYLNSATTGGGSATIIIDASSGDQNIYGSTGSIYTGRMPNVTLNKSSGNLNLSNNICLVAPTFSVGAGTIVPGSSTVNFYDNKTISGSMTLNNVSFTGTGSYTNIVLTSTITVNGTLTTEGTVGLAIFTGVIQARGDITLNNSALFGGGSTTILINGTGSQTLTGRTNEGESILPQVTINKASGTLSLANIISLNGDWIYTAGTVSPGSSTVSFFHYSFNGAQTISGTHTLNNVALSPSASNTVVVSNALTVSNLTYNGTTSAITVNTGTINVTGNLTTNNTASAGGGSALLNITGTGTQTLSSSSSGTVTPGPIGPVNISKTGGTLTISNNINAGGDWTYSASSTTLSAGSSTVLFTKTSPTITGSHTLANVKFSPSASSTVTIALGNTLTSSGTLSFAGSSAMVFNTGTLSATGSSISITNTSGGSTFGNATFLINGTGTQTLSCSTGAPVIPNLTINKSSGTLVISGSNVAVGGNLTHTAGTVSVDSTNKISLYGNFNISASAITFGSVDIAGGTRALAADLNVYKTLSIQSSKKLDASGTAYNIHMQGDWSNAGTFASGAGYLRFTGTKSQSITESSGDTIAKLKIDKVSGNVTLSSAVTVTDTLKFVKGNIITTSTNLLSLNKRAGVSGAGSSTGFVSGPVKKIGNTAFTFPVGKSANYQPIKISAPASATDAFTAEYFNSGQTDGSTTDTTLKTLSTCEYWNLARTTGSSSVSVTPGWNSSSCNVATAPRLITMRVAWWNAAASKWNDVGEINLTGNASNGTITSGAALNNFGHFTLAQENYHALALYYQKHDIDANGANNSGYILVSGSNGLPPYHYKWEDNSANPTRYDLLPGTYSVAVSDSLQDTVRQTFSVGRALTPLFSNNAVVAGTSYTNTAVAGGGAASITFADEINAGDDGWIEFTLQDTSSSVTVGFQPDTYDTSSLLNYKPFVQTADKYISRAAMAAYPALKATYDTLSSGYADSILVHQKKLLVNNGTSNVLLSNYYALVISHNKLYTFIGGITNQRVTNILPGDVLRIGRTSGSIAVMRNGMAQVVENSSIGSVNISPQVFVINASATLGGLVANVSTAYSPIFALACLIEKNMNYVETKTYDENGTVVSNSKQYFDYLGRNTQSQQRMLTDNNTLAVQNLFDGYGRAVASTLPAPIYTSSLCYSPGFVHNAADTTYSYNDFDKPINTGASGEVNNPASVHNSTQGELGWYYSDNNSSEAFVATAGLPYSRIEYYNDPYNRIKRAAGVGDVLKMGSGYESQVYYMSNAGELDYVYSSLGSYQLADDFTPEANKNQNLQLFKTITVNADGKESISFSNSSGQTIATCMSGATTATYSNCIAQSVSQNIKYYKFGYTDIHLPAATNGTLKLPLLCLRCVPDWYSENLLWNIMNACPAVIKYRIFDVSTGKSLTAGATSGTGDYYIDPSTRAVTFNGAYSGTTLFLRIAYDIKNTTACSTVVGTSNIESIMQSYVIKPDVMPELAVEYDLDYSNWSLNYTDVKGHVIGNVAPNDVDCSTYFTSVDYHNFNYSHNLFVSCNSTALEIDLTGLSVPSGGSRNISLAGNLFLQPTPVPLDVHGQCTYPTSSERVSNAELITRSGTVSTARRTLGRSSGESLTTDSISLKIRQDSTFRHINQVWPDSLFFLTKTILPLYDASGTIIDTASVFNYLYTDTVPRTDSVGVPIDSVFTASVAREVPAAYIMFRVTFEVSYQLASSSTYTLATTYPVEVLWMPGNTQNTQRVNNAQMLNLQNGINAFMQASVSNTIVKVFVSPILYEVKFVGFGVPPNYNPYGFNSGYYPAEWGSPGGALTTDLQTMWDKTWLKTSDIYLGLDALVADYNTLSVSQTLTKKAIYDDHNRVAASISDDEGETDYVYDNEDKLRFSQNDKQRVTGSGGKFTYVNYDAHARPVEVGEYDPTHSGSGNPYYFRTYAQYEGSTNTAPSGHTDIFTDISGNIDAITPGGRTSQQTYSAYDEPDAYLSGYVSGYNQKYVTGKVSRTWNSYDTSWYSYDELGRLAWAVQYTNETLLGHPYKTYNYTYDMLGNLLQTDYNKEDATESFYHKFEYDADQRLTQASTGFNGTSWTLQDKYYYYLHGPLKREEIQTSLQGIDYVYTIGGQLKSINHPSLNNAYDPGQDSHSGAHSSFKNDVFGFALDYFTGDYTRTGSNVQSDGTDFHSGIIQNTRWQTQVPSSTTGLFYTSGQQLMYQYDYDELYRLNRATFCTYAGSTSTMTVTALSDYRVDNLTYDRNGNIQSLRRRMQNTNYPFTAPTMDDLTYSYDGTKTNRLKQVSDASTTTPLSADIDLPDQSNSSNYTYNAIGQAITNVQEGITMEYDVYGQVTRVYKTSTGYNVATYIYNDKGLRAAKIAYDGSGEPLTQTNYMYDGAGNLACTYETSWATGSAVTTIKDYPIYGASRIGIYDATSPRNSSAVYYYEMSDHLGNVRAVYKNNGSGAEIVSFTDYYPHGGAMPARNYTATNYRYGYQGQEKDPETNQTSFELRQFDPRIGRWIAPDPMGQYHSLYMAMGNNPISMVDPSGGDDIPWDVIMNSVSILVQAGLNSYNYCSSNGRYNTSWDGGGDLQKSNNQIINGSLKLQTQLDGPAYWAATVDVQEAEAAEEEKAEKMEALPLEAISFADQYKAPAGVIPSIVMAPDKSSLKQGEPSWADEWHTMNTYLTATSPASPMTHLSKIAYGILDEAKSFFSVLNPHNTMPTNLREQPLGYSGRMNVGVSGWMSIMSAPLGGIFGGFSEAKELVSKGQTIVGEGMKRVSMEAAKRPGSIILNNMPKFTGNVNQITSQMMTFNRKWILQQMRSGRPILDIGLDASRANPSIFYQMEQNMMKNYLKMYPNSFQIIK